MGATYLSYSKDHSGFGFSLSEHLSGGYFNLQPFLEVYLYADFTEPLEGEYELNFIFGPKLQYVDDATVAGEASSGFSGSISYTRKQTDSRFLILKAAHDFVGDRYPERFCKRKWFLIFDRFQRL
jgi:hypothetical protein